MSRQKFCMGHVLLITALLLIGGGIWLIRTDVVLGSEIAHKAFLTILGIQLVGLIVYTLGPYARKES